MSPNPIIRGVELIAFEFTKDHLTTDAAQFGISFTPGQRNEQLRFGVRIHTDTGVVGEYIPPRGRAKLIMAAVEALSHLIIDRPALAREAVYARLRRATKHVGEVGIGPLDIALWDLAGRLHDQPIHRLLGGSQTRLPAYASTLMGDSQPGGLSSPEAYADFAEQCLELGYPAYKMHGWGADVAREISMLEAVAHRVGGRMGLMYDAGSHLPTLADAIKVGQVCDALGYEWLEDPYNDGGLSIHGHRRLKASVKTPIMITEHVRNAETTTDIVALGASDFSRVDPDYDGGITGSLKAALAAESLGFDTEVHSCGPAMRQLMAALARSRYYEVNLVHPTAGNAWSPPIYACGYHDELDCIAPDGTVDVGQRPGLGVDYDWDFISKHEVARVVIGAV
ncbi:MAG: mandelate racemase/muconate lactonizing protein [Gammaproteobacteria bacterium]|nr:mandelate racemase/muconate lactonizing protein [Gammaproteobacteria bacterium]